MKTSTKWFVGILIGLIIIIGGFFAWQKLKTNLVISPVAKNDGKVVIPRYDNGKLIYTYFDTVSKKIVLTTEDNNSTGFSVGTESSVLGNDPVQFSTDGQSYFLACEDPAKSGPEMPALIAKIYQAPDKLIFGVDETKEGVFSGWRLTKNGSKIYILTSVDKNNNWNLISVNTGSLEQKTIANVGKVNTKLFINDSETEALVGEPRERIENGYHFYDMYVKIINLNTSKINEKLIWKDRQPGPFPFFQLDSMSFSPDFTKAVDDYTANGVYTVRVINLANQSEKDIYQFNGSAQAGNIVWSPDGTKVIFSSKTYGSTIPQDQGVLMYDFKTNKTTQLVKTNISSQNGLMKGEARVFDNSFNGNSFVYLEGNAVKYFDISQMESSTIISNVSNSYIDSAYHIN